MNTPSSKGLVMADDQVETGRLGINDCVRIASWISRFGSSISASRPFPRMVCARHQLNVAVKRTQVLDDGLMISQHFVDYEAASTLFSLCNHDLFALRPLGSHLKVIPEPDVGDCFTPQGGDLLTIRLLDVLLR